MALWDDEQWASRRDDLVKVARDLSAAGYEVKGFSNGKPKLDGDVDWTEVQGIVCGDSPVPDRKVVTGSKKKGKRRG